MEVKDCGRNTISEVKCSYKFDDIPANRDKAVVIAQVCAKTPSRGGGPIC